MRPMGEAIATFGFVSRSRVPAQQAAAELARIVETSTRSNSRHDITGALITAGAYLAQVIEGPPARVEDIRLCILVDPRHEAVVELELTSRTRRRFTTWTLAYSGGSRFFERFLQELHEGPAEARDVARLERMLWEFSEGER